MNGLGWFVGVGEVAVERGLEIDDAAEDAVLQLLRGEFGEHALDRGEPGGRGRGEMEVKPRMPFEPGADPGLCWGVPSSGFLRPRAG
jgi:hypothetical protein